MNFPDGIILGALFTGKAVVHWPGKPASAIVKHRLTGRVRVKKTGMEGDEQADLAVHGGPEKAIHHYAADHYPFWQTEFPDSASRFAPGAFGENLSTTGLTEDQLCIGDILRIGSAIVQVTQGRQPCWKLSAHIGRDDMAARFQRSRRTGWYYRVIEEGFMEANDPVALIERVHPEWPLATVIAARFNPKLDPEIARSLTLLASMSSSWRRAFSRKSDPDYAEDTTARLIGQ